MLQRVQMFCLCAGLCLYLGFRFRHFPYSLYTFLSVCKSITALSYDWRLSRYRSYQAWLGVGILFLDAWGSWTPGRLFHPTKVGHSNNLAFAEFEKIHPTCWQPIEKQPLSSYASIAFRLRDSLLPTYRFGSRWSGRGFTPAFFGGAPIKMSADILFKDRCSIQLSYGQFIF